MSTTTTIEWTRGDDGAAGATWSPTLGCQRKSEGCENCYAIRTVHRIAHHPNPKVSQAAAGLTEHRDGRLDWTGIVRFLPDRIDLPLRWRKPRRIFVNSQSDLFDATDEEIAQVFAMMAVAHWHTYQILTKTHARMRSLVGNRAFRERVAELAAEFSEKYGRPTRWVWPLPNVWLGVSVENQKWADLRIPALLNTPAAVRWLSCEPLLGPVDLRRAVATMGSERGHGLTASFVHAGDCCRRFHGIDWVVVGGESGPGARPMHPDWARSLRDQCTTAGVPYFFKQWGAWAPAGLGIGMAEHNVGREVLVGPPLDEMGHRQVMRRVGKGGAGRELDGRTWDQFPEEVHT